MVFGIVATGLAWFGGLSLLTFLLPFLVLAFVWKPQNLKEKYKCEWALVTGSSSGIGKVLTEKLCEQGLNVVMVALDDKLLDDSHKEIAAKFPAVQVSFARCEFVSHRTLRSLLRHTFHECWD